MKIKIFALIMAVFCLSTLFVGCDQKCVPHVDENADLICDTCGEALAAPACKPHVDENKDYVCDNCPETFIRPCEADHKDENADKYCDACGLAIVTITELVPPTAADRVDMVVKPLPESGNYNDYDQFVENTDKIISATEIDGYVHSHQEDIFYYIVTETTTINEVEISYEKHIVKSMATGAVLFEASNRYEGEGYVSINVQLYENFFLAQVTTHSFYNSDVVYNTYKYVAYDGTVLFDVKAQYEDVTEFDNFSSVDHAALSYFFFDNTVFVYDRYTGEKVHQCDKIDLIYRPDFNHTTERYGFVEKDNGVFVYDLTKWVECVYSYTLPSYYEDAEFFYVNDNRILLQASVELVDNAVNYDVVENGVKYDIIYLVIDPVAKTETAIEFGYAISYAWTWSEEEGKALNYVVANPIVDDRIDYNNTLNLLTDKDFNITLSIENTEAYFVAPNTLLVEDVIGYTEVYDDWYGWYNADVVVRKLVDATSGALIAYVPEDADIYDDFILYDGKIYDFKMTMVFDPEANGYLELSYDYVADDLYVADDFVILFKPVYEEDGVTIKTYDKYFYTVANGAVRIDLDNCTVMDVNHFGFVARHAVAEIDEYGNPVLKTVYSLFNNAGEKIIELDNAIYDYFYVDNILVIITYSGTYYLVQ